MRAMFRNLLLVQGIFAVLFGMFALVFPSETLLGLTVFLGALFVIEGVFAVLFGLVLTRYRFWWALVVYGLVVL